MQNSNSFAAEAVQLRAEDTLAASANRPNSCPVRVVRYLHDQVAEMSVPLADLGLSPVTSSLPLARSRPSGLAAINYLLDHIEDRMQVAVFNSRSQCARSPRCSSPPQNEQLAG